MSSEWSQFERDDYTPEALRMMSALSGNRITEVGLDRLKKAIPKLRVFRYPNPRLSVSPRPSE